MNYLEYPHDIDSRIIFSDQMIGVLLRLIELVYVLNKRTT